jgi:hypothetical protein
MSLALLICKIVYDTLSTTTPRGNNMQDKSNFIQMKRSTFRTGMIILYAFFLSLIAYIYTPQILTPKPGEHSWRCTTAQWYVGLARAAGENCTTKCTNWEAADCSGYSSCFKKNISCNGGIDQNGRPCKGCCFDCVVECTPTDEPPTIKASVSCDQWGTNGWCRNAARLDLNASDPQGYDLSITGSTNGTPITCTGSCSIDLPAGSGSSNFTAKASQSGLSVSGNMNWQYDPEPPGMNLNVSGSSGHNGWYISPVTINSTGSDSISGLAGAFLSVDGGSWQTSATLGDGQHTVDVTASDNAGNIVSSSTTISVDTKTPSIHANINGNLSKRGWFSSDTTISASASDSTSGIASFEFSADGKSYQPYSLPITFVKGQHTIRFRATDQAGNRTETPEQTISVDQDNPSVTIATSDLPDGSIVYRLHDGESGLASLYLTIEDKNGQYPKIKWNSIVSGNDVSGNYKWNGKFEGGIVAPPGEYIIWIKGVDQAGNEESQISTITIPTTAALVVDSLFDIVEKEEPISVTDDLSQTDGTVNTPTDLLYGDSDAEASDSANQSLALSANTASTQGNPYPWAQVLGPITVAAGVATFVATRNKPQRSEEQKAATRARILAEKEAQWDAKALVAKASETMKIARMEAAEGIAWIKRLQPRPKPVDNSEKEAQTQAGMEAYYNARKQGEVVAALSAPPKAKSWWEKTIDYVDQHQVEFSLGVGAFAAVGVIALATIVSAPAIAFVAGAALVAGVTITVWTAALNSYYGRQWNKNIGRNIFLAGVSAAAVSGAWFLLQGATTAVGTYCGIRPDVCARVEPILETWDTIEQISLQAKMAYQNWRNDPAAQDTALELQMEYLDGGMPGNSTAHQIADLGEDALEILRLYGDDAIPLLLKYGDDAVDIIGAYGDDGVEILQKYGRDAIEPILKYGDDAVELIQLYGADTIPILLKFDREAIDIIGAYGEDGIRLLKEYGDDAVEIVKKYGDSGIHVLKTHGKDAVDLINSYGAPAVKVLEAVNVENAKRLLTSLDGDVLDYAVQQGPDAIWALSLWDDDLLKDKSMAPRLALRSGQDALVLNDVIKLITSGPVDPAKLTKEQQELLNAIARNSTQYPDELQVVVGKWINARSGFLEIAQSTGSVHYGPHPEVWNLLGALGTENQSEVAWLINQRVILTGVNKKLPFEYTLNGVDPEKVDNEIAMVEAIWKGANDNELLEIFDPTAKKLPVRAQEIKELYKAGYELSFDTITNSFIFIKP